jgi:uncharacterized membrane protein
MYEVYATQVIAQIFILHPCTLDLLLYEELILTRVYNCTALLLRKLNLNITRLNINYSFAQIGSWINFIILSCLSVSCKDALKAR